MGLMYYFYKKSIHLSEKQISPNYHVMYFYNITSIYISICVGVRKKLKNQENRKKNNQKNRTVKKNQLKF